jgi:hypothetical protein
MANKNKAPNTLASIQGSNEIDDAVIVSSFGIAWCNSYPAASYRCAHNPHERGANYVLQY